VFAKFQDGSVLNVSKSSFVTYTSSSNSVATVDKHGVVTAVASGYVSIKATYIVGADTRSLTTTIPVTVPPHSTQHNKQFHAPPFTRGEFLHSTLQVTPFI
jgi:hypothetical protein